MALDRDPEKPLKPLKRQRELFGPEEPASGETRPDWKVDYVGWYAEYEQMRPKRKDQP